MGRAHNKNSVQQLDLRSYAARCLSVYIAMPGHMLSAAGRITPG